MSERSTEHDTAAQGDDPQRSSTRDGAGRSRPGRDAPGDSGTREGMVRPVPHEGFFGRLAACLLAGQSVVLAVIAVWTFIGAATAGSPVTVVNLRMSVPHAGLLAATAVLGVAACAARRWSRRWAAVQFAGYLVVFLVGLTLGANEPQPGWLQLNGPDHFLHLAVALLGFVTLMLFSARIVEPPPGSAPSMLPDDTDGRQNQR